ncbi:pyrroline-5-carboxylate reductase [Robertkochia sediminum]|uniref:pyrroline-5-carboxylate reductase n=1 Tax=Robertkochia sediminum TaxID=2785326 RepID=UPI0019344C11|nr:pyrroline-5-carboxylate reductase [Robertkochia sediminum]MBL7473350.1 pyrroline-5-carboxylate reductase [Robertkochia sediminum]
MKTAIIGTGNLGAAIARGIIKDDLASQLTLTKRKLEELHTFERHHGVQCTRDNLAAATDSDVIIMAVQPTQMEGLLQELSPVIRNKQLLISVATGYGIDQMEAILGSDKPIMRAMPNTAIGVGHSMTTLCGNKASEGLEHKAESIFNSLGKTLHIPEEKMQAATVVCASGIAFWMRLIRATTQGAIQLGFDSGEAREMAIQTCFGAASLLQHSGSHPEAEIDKVTTPMGCTIEGLNEMEFQGMSASLIKGMKASFEKINEIAIKK